MLLEDDAVRNRDRCTQEAVQYVSTQMDDRLEVDSNSYSGDVGLGFDKLVRAETMKNCRFEGNKYTYESSTHVTKAVK